MNKVLIANRGEIAVRLIRACKALDLHSVAVYSDADAGALHVALADEAVHIGAAEARASYLDGEKLIQAALTTGAGAIHPGYGFLAESAAFAEACTDAGLVFVGPDPSVIASMGSKIEAKQIARKAGVDCVPGYHGADQTDERLLKEAQLIGTPLLIKASAGGGGRGMRRVDDLGEFASALSLAREEARAAFGDASILLERFIEAPRHIEVQILGDRHGNVRHLFERDCSVQRNYQKVIEEAPAPNLPQALREQMLAQAVQLSQAIAYSSAGTVEFVVDTARNQAYFLEMNTRLQVEHPVTEMITGIDLVEWQLRVAQGEALAFSQDDIACTGWAMEARLAAENPAAGYQAQTGCIAEYVEPDIRGLRIDSGVRAGSNISPYYDSMLAKLIAHAPDRPAAIRKLRRSLAELQVSGVGVNRDFLRDVLDIPAFVAGEHLTSLLETTWPDGWDSPALSLREQATAVLIKYLASHADSGATAWASLGAWRLGEPSGREATATYYLVGDEAIDFQIAHHGDALVLSCGDDVVLTAQQARLHAGRLHYSSDDQSYKQTYSLRDDLVCLHDASGQPELRIVLAEHALIGDAREQAINGEAIVAPTPGQVVKLMVAPGDAVTKGQPVLVLEAMKMLQQLCAGQDGVVRQVAVREGDAVNGGDSLVLFEPTE